MTTGVTNAMIDELKAMRAEQEQTQVLLGQLHDRLDRHNARLVAMDSILVPDDFEVETLGDNTDDDVKSCPGCATDEKNQLGHMVYGGCLYEDPLSNEEEAALLALPSPVSEKPGQRVWDTATDKVKLYMAQEFVGGWVEMQKAQIGDQKCALLFNEEGEHEKLPVNEQVLNLTGRSILGNVIVLRGNALRYWTGEPIPVDEVTPGWFSDDDSGAESIEEALTETLNEFNREYGPESPRKRARTQ